MNNLATLTRTLLSELDTKEVLSASILEELSLELNNYAEKYIKNIYSKHDYDLLDMVYVKESFLDTEEKINDYFRASLSLAIKEFKELISQMNNDNIISRKEHIISYLYDIGPFIEFFEKKQNEDYVLFHRDRNYYTTSQEIRKASYSLFWQSPQMFMQELKTIKFILRKIGLRKVLQMNY